MYGYERIPEDVDVPIGVTTPRPKDITLQRIRHTLSAYGVDEAMTPSAVSQSLESSGSLWTQNQPLSVETPLLEGARLLRRSLVPSLLSARYTNQSLSIKNAELYEVATIFLAADQQSALPLEKCALGIVTSGDLQRLKGIVEAILGEVAGPETIAIWRASEHPLFQSESGQQILTGDSLIGFLGLVNRKLQDELSLDQPVAAAELDVDVLTEFLLPIRTAHPYSAFPAVQRDLNFIVDEQTRWAELSAICSQHGGDYLQNVEYRETYRDSKKDGPGKKRTLLTLSFQSLQRTLTGAEVDQAVQQIIAACSKHLGAMLLG
jgi:phenylalanyl-tRNA synthetase beta chain